MKRIKISVVITAHREQHCLWMSLKSIFLMVQALSSEQISSELILVADDVDKETKNIIDCAKDQITSVIYCNNKDPALSRNTGINEAKGELVAVLDGDDLYSKNWLVDSYSFFKKSKNKKICLHPQYNLVFRDFDMRFCDDIYWWKHIDQDSGQFSSINMMISNHWQANCIFPKSMIDKVSYVPTIHDKGIGYEDWAFNCDVISAGYIHKTVPGTSHLLRIKSCGSRNQAATDQALVVRQVKLFEEILEIDYPNRKIEYYSEKESKQLPEQLQKHVNELSCIEPGIMKQASNTNKIQRHEPLAMPAAAFKDYKKLTSILDATVSFIGKDFSKRHTYSLGSVIYTDDLSKSHPVTPYGSDSIKFSHRPNIRSRNFFISSHLCLRGFFNKNVTDINVINSLLGIYLVTNIWNAYQNNFNIVFYFIDLNEDAFINEFGPEVMRLIQLGTRADNIRLSQILYDKFLDIYSEQWTNHITMLE